MNHAEPREHDAGARPDPVAGTGRRAAPEAAAPGDPAAVAVRAILVAHWRRLQENEPAARRGEVEGVHQMRIATRRLRSGLRMFRPLIAGEGAERLAADLQWLARTLGAVRDLDVLRAQFLAAADGLDVALEPLFATLDRRHAPALAALQAVLDGPRYRDLLQRLEAAARDLALTADAAEPCRRALPALAARAWKKLKGRGRALTPLAPDEDLHTVRKRAKDARYAAEAVAGSLGRRRRKAALRFAARARRVQELLGAHQDAVVARGLIAPLVAARPDDGAFLRAAGLVLAVQDRAVAAARARFPKAWKKLDRRRNRRWLKARRGR